MLNVLKDQIQYRFRGSDTVSLLLKTRKHVQRLLAEVSGECGTVGALLAHAATTYTTDCCQ